VACHSAAEVPETDPVRLTEIIRGGLFQKETNNDYCLSCHALEGRSLTLANGDELSLTIDEDALHDSVHGAGNPWQPLECTDCHLGAIFPHGPVEASSRREYTLQQYELCARCHEKNYAGSLDDVHGKALAEGNLDAAVCTDCHGAHETPPPDEPRERISHTCQQCHSTIFDAYASSVHGEALLADSNPDVATCVDCHGVHDIVDPTTAEFRIGSPQLCANCHADEELMAAYDVSTEVFDTYVADFHGTTTTLFDPADPNAEPNEAVCYDCHGIHDIRPPDEATSGIRANLLETCRQCHPDATENFPSAWTSHYRPSLEHNPLVFLVNTFYAVVIPATVAGLSLLVVTDIYGRARRRAKKG
jgi:predicted CXXCH cytochrome family protein